MIGVGYELEVRTQEGQEVNTFNSELTVSLPYDPTSLAQLHLRPADLSMRYWNEASSTWQEVSNAIVDETNNLVTASVAHLTRFAIVASTDTTPPTAPLRLKAKAASDGVVLTWVKPKDPDFKYAKLYRASEEGSLGEVIANNLTVATYKDAGMARGHRYFYIVRSVDTSNNESTNITPISVLIGGKGVLGKAVARKGFVGVSSAPMSVKGTIKDVNVIAGSMEILQQNKKTILVAFSSDLKVLKDGKKASIADLKVGNSIEATGVKSNTDITLSSVKAKSIKLNIKGSLEDTQVKGAKGKVKVKVKSTTGKVKGFQIKRGQELTFNVESDTVQVNGKSVPLDLMQLSDDSTIEGVIENGGITIKRITSKK